MRKKEPIEHLFTTKLTPRLVLDEANENCPRTPMDGLRSKLMGRHVVLSNCLIFLRSIGVLKKARRPKSRRASEELLRESFRREWLCLRDFIESISSIFGFPRRVVRCLFSTSCPDASK
jgi:hypothetical protein